MANIAIFKRNALSDGVTVLKNLTGGGSGISEDADWPMVNLTNPDRYSYWKSADGLAAGIFNVDFDLGSSQLISYLCLTDFRYYNSIAFTDAAPVVYYSNGGSYPPTWTLFGTLDASANDNYLEFGITCRFIRFEFNMGGPPFSISLNLWAVKSSELMTLSHDWGLETELTNRRTKDTKRSPSGLLFEFEPQQAHASDIAGGRLVLSTALLSEWQLLRDGLSAVDSRFIVLDAGEFRIYETTLPAGRISASRRFANLYSLELKLEAHP